MPNCKAEAPLSCSYLPAATLATYPWDDMLHPNKDIEEPLQEKSLS